MSTPVHIFITVRKRELIDAALLVFKTLRVGFPRANVFIWGNGLDRDTQRVIAAAAQNVGGVFRNLPATSHDCWIDGLLQSQCSPFWICDTDIVFFEHVQDLSSPLFAGRFEPEFNEEWTQSLHVARLHTALMYFNPGPLRAAMRGWMCKFPEPWRNSAQFPFVHQHFIPHKDGTMFYDSCAGLYQALGGTAFTEEQNKCFEHLHCATYADLIAPHLNKGQNILLEAHRAIYDNPELARGIRSKQNEYYARQCPTNSPAAA